MTANRHYATFYYTTDGDKFELADDHAFKIEFDERYVSGARSTMAAEACARDYFYNHDGWERSDWGEGVHFALWRSLGDKIGDFTVSMEMQPAFSAWAGKRGQTRGNYLT